MSNVERAAKVIEAELKRHPIVGPDRFGGQIGTFGGMSPLEIAQALADAGVILRGDAEVTVEYGVRIDDDDSRVSWQPDQAKATLYADRYGGEAVQRTVTTVRSEWTEVAK